MCICACGIHHSVQRAQHYPVCVRVRNRGTNQNGDAQRVRWGSGGHVFFKFKVSCLTARNRSPLCFNASSKTPLLTYCP